MIAASLALAKEIAGKSPIAVQATKKNLVYSLEHTNQEGLNQIVSKRKKCKLIARRVLSQSRHIKKEFIAFVFAISFVDKFLNAFK